MTAKSESPLPGIEEKGLDVPYKARQTSAERELKQALAGPKPQPAKTGTKGRRKH